MDEQQQSRTTLFAVDVATGYMEVRKRNLGGDVEYQSRSHTLTLRAMPNTLNGSGFFEV